MDISSVKIISGRGQQTITTSLEALELPNSSGCTPRQIILSYHGYGERAETQARRMTELELGDDVLWICPQALHSFAITSRQGQAHVPEVEQWGWSWMAKATRERDIQLNKESTLHLWQHLQEALGVSEASLEIILMGHSQGASHAWRVASWIPVTRIYLHAGDLPPELRKQWPLEMQTRLSRVVLGRGLDDSIYSELILKRDLKHLKRFTDRLAHLELELWEGDGTHHWRGDWVSYLKSQHIL